MPPGFDYPDKSIDLWSPWDLEASYAGRYGARATTGPPRDWRFLKVVGRLAEEVDLTRAQQELTALAAALEEQHPDYNRGWGIRLVQLEEEMLGPSRLSLLMLLGAAACLLLLVCANVANLTMARGAQRHREVALRQALGAPRFRLVRQFLTEGLLVSLFGGAVGVALGQASLPVVRALAPAGLPRVEDIAVNGRVLAFALALTVTTGVAFGLLPALRAARADVLHSFREGTWATGGGHRLRRLLAVAQVSLAVVLLVGAALLGKSLSRLRAVDTGFRADNLLVLRASVSRNAYSTGAKVADYYERVVSTVSARPGVESAAATTVLPLSDVGVDFSRPYWRFADPRPAGDGPKADIRMITPAYFETMGMRLIRGRVFTEQDRRDTPAVVVINESLSSKLWPETGPLGERLVLDYNRGVYSYEVVGVVNDSHYYGPRSESRPEVFIPHAQNPYPALNVVVRTRVEAGSLARAAEKAIREVDATQPVYRVTTMEALLSASLATDRLAAVLLGGFALVALLVAATGIYGVLSMLVSERTREIGVRVALGAARRDIFKTVVGQGMLLAAGGGVLGAGAALGLTRLLAGLLYGVSPTDGVSFGLGLSILTLVALLACYVPARRALGVDPSVALRFE